MILGSVVKTALPLLDSGNVGEGDILVAATDVSVPGFIAELGPVCRDTQREELIRASRILNGIDYVEYKYVEYKANSGQTRTRHFLFVQFFRPLPQSPRHGPVGAYGLTTQPDLVRIEGGVRIVNIRVLHVSLDSGQLKIEVDRQGDFSTYWLLLGWQHKDGHWKHVIGALDPQFSRAPVNFRASCSVDFDCRQVEICPPERRQEPLIDYLAKDYASFRQLLLDLIPQRNPEWLERNPADLGIALVELLAYTGDHLSYFQDAVANEAYLDTARQRISAKRHARLIDYQMHDGRNAWTFVHFTVTSKGTIPQNTKVLSRITSPLQNQTSLPGVVIQEGSVATEAFASDPALVRVRAFETTFPLNVHPENSEIFLHTWGNRECCLPRGATSAYVYSLDPSDPQQAVRPQIDKDNFLLEKGDLLLLEEIKGPNAGAPADPAHRQVVQLVDVEETKDPAFQDQLANGQLQVRRNDNDTPLPLLRVTWRQEDALAFPLCLSTQPDGQDPVANISVARGNIVLADHGLTVHDPQSPPVAADTPFRLRLKQGPLTMQCQPEAVPYEVDLVTEAVSLTTPRTTLSGEARRAQPALALLVHSSTDPEVWTPVPDLLSSSAFDKHFVVDVDNGGRATLRFGDGVYGQEPVEGTTFTAWYRVGNGRAGNIGSEALAHIVQPTTVTDWPSILAVRNPLPAQEGTDPETIEEVRQFAPAAFRAELFRAVTEADYTAAARKIPGIAGAVATFRWTGSWYTVFVGVDPRNPADVITESGGRTFLVPSFERRVRDGLTRYKLAGYDLEICSGEYVPLAIDLELCIGLDHFRGDVAEAVYQVLSNRINPDRTFGFFHPDHFTFGQAVYLSKLYAAVEAVEGVNSVMVTRFQRFGKVAAGELEAGVLPIGPWEIARLDNDPNFMERGVLRISAKGGK